MYKLKLQGILSDKLKLQGKSLDKLKLQVFLLDKLKLKGNFKLLKKQYEQWVQERENKKNSYLACKINVLFSIKNTQTKKLNNICQQLYKKHRKS